jgi:hypothetical protein
LKISCEEKLQPFEKPEYIKIVELAPVIKPKNNCEFPERITLGTTGTRLFMPFVTPKMVVSERN